jgi:hypothetical protein
MAFAPGSADAGLADAALNWASGEATGIPDRTLSDENILGVVSIEDSNAALQVDGMMKTAYATTTIDAPEATVAEFALGSSVPLSVWVNGEQAYVHSGADDVYPDQRRFFADLKPGSNTIVVRISTTRDVPRFCLGRVMPDSEVKVASR